MSTQTIQTGKYDFTNYKFTRRAYRNYLKLCVKRGQKRILLYDEFFINFSLSDEDDYEVFLEIALTEKLSRKVNISTLEEFERLEKILGYVIKKILTEYEYLYMIKLKEEKEKDIKMKEKKNENIESLKQFIEKDIKENYDINIYMKEKGYNTKNKKHIKKAYKEVKKEVKKAEIKKMLKWSDNYKILTDNCITESLEMLEANETYCWFLIKLNNIEIAVEYKNFHLPTGEWSEFTLNLGKENFNYDNDKLSGFKDELNIQLNKQEIEVQYSYFMAMVMFILNNELKEEYELVYYYFRDLLE